MKIKIIYEEIESVTIDGNTSSFAVYKCLREVVMVGYFCMIERRYTVELMNWKFQINE